jgi:hypothetical protein
VLRQLFTRGAAFPSVRAGIGREDPRSMASFATCPCSALETITQFRGSAIALSAAAFTPKDSISLLLSRDVDRAQRGRETAEMHDRFQGGRRLLS